MDLSNKRNRDELKSFFKKNDIPTERNFADLIDGMLNQKDDGVAKQPNSPFSIEADPSAQQNALSLYLKLADNAPAWTLSLKNPDGSRAGLSINDINKNSRLFIDANGNTGVGVTNPAEALEINGRLKLGTLTTGAWPANPSRYVFWGTNTLDQAQAGNYALLQGLSGSDAGTVFLNSPTDLHLRINNGDKLVIANNGDAQFTGSVKITGSLDAGSITQENWVAPTLLNGWVNYGGGFNDAGYFKDSFGIVHLRGLVKSGQTQKAIFNLPNGYRPARRELHAACTNPDSIGRIDIATNGDVIMQTGNNGWISLDGITFQATWTFFIPLPPLHPINPINPINP
ncbi:hypothetical protein VSS37_20750 [Candidatus Thiothrix sp. Deng01]|uniref:Tail fiber protein n=1 Tax=Candidatus Thiothrix phosphatis TaxID=3112415 RepID=A0ABU6D536_9GAMM|nr:hypothetical protein [Candidatus Thiothrix sp. Deng01]MEB4593419.1 hypothetical protein [Candidatus Thiothrix sp. Deng01]